jgi:hypothetical protein
MNSSMTLYQSAILQDDKRTAVCNSRPYASRLDLTSTYLSQPNTTHVKYTSAEPFTPKFVKDHLLTTKSTTKRSSSLRAQALYDERVHRRQLGLVARRGAKAKKEKKGVAVVKREKMGRREAAEKGMWRLREEEARCVALRSRGGEG